MEFEKTVAQNIREAVRLSGKSVIALSKEFGRTEQPNLCVYQR
jgi:hypothetical protein